MKNITPLFILILIIIISFLEASETQKEGLSWNSSTNTRDSVLKTAQYFNSIGYDKDYFASIGSPSAFLELCLYAAQYHNGRTYIVFQGINFNPYVIYYDHTAGRWSDPVQVGNTTLTDDAHGAPALLIDNNGYIHVFYGSHCESTQKYVKSTNPENIYSWTTMPNLEPYPATYPQVMQMSDGTIYLFYRAGGHTDNWVYQTSKDSGNSWSEATSIIDGVEPQHAWYAMFKKGPNNTIHAAFLWKDDTNFLFAPRPEWYHRYNIYYMFKDTDGKWKNISGTYLPLPLTKINAEKYAKVYDSGNNHTQIPWLGIDKNNNPYILFITGGYYGNTNYVYKMAKWTENNWNIIDIGATTDNLFDFYLIDVISSTNIDAYITTGGTSGFGDMRDRGGNIEKWSTTNGGKNWKKAEVIISKFKTGTIYNNPQPVLNYQQDAKIVFSEWNNDLNNFNNKLFLWGDSGFVQNKSNEFSIISIEDIPYDYGKEVSINWNRHPDDTTANNNIITKYSIWRRIDQYLSQNIQKMTVPDEEWILVKEIPAVQNPVYHTNVPTLADAVIDNIRYYTTFFIRAHTSNPLIYWKTAPYSGYSIDNFSPNEYIIKQNYPNPFNPITFIEYEIPEETFVSLKIYDILGQTIKTLVNQVKPAGYHKAVWNGTNKYSIKVASGVYIYRIQTGKSSFSRKMMLLR